MNVEFWDAKPVKATSVGAEIRCATGWVSSGNVLNEILVFVSGRLKGCDNTVICADITRPIQMTNGLSGNRGWSS